MVERANPAANPLWTCPQCGRRFARRKQAHSCKTQGVDDHFRGKDPKLRSLFDAIRRALERTGPLRIDAVQSTINLVSRRHFGGIAVRRDHLRVGFLADHEIADERIVRAERLGPHKVSHHVVVRSMNDVDSKLLGWLADAQELQAHTGGRRTE